MFILSGVGRSSEAVSRYVIPCRQYLPDSENADVAVVLGYALNRLPMHNLSTDVILLSVAD